MGVRSSLNMRVGLTFVRETFVCRTFLNFIVRNCRTRAKSRKSKSAFFSAFFKKVLQKRPSRPVERLKCTLVS